METKQNGIWAPVKAYEGLYEINREGVVRSLQNKNQGYIMKQRIDRAGYFTVRLAKSNLKSSTKYVHRLLGFAFIDNSNNKPIINHKDGNKLNNNIENLEWATTSENMKHAYENRLFTSFKGKCRKIINNCTGTIYNSIKEAAENTSINYSTLKNYLNGNRPNTTCLKHFEANGA